MERGSPSPPARPAAAVSGKTVPPWRETARRIETRYWNRRGTDKTWVLRVMWEHQEFQREVRRARRVDAR